MTERSVAHSTFTITRRYEADPARVFAAWADPDAKHAWFAVEDGWTTEHYELDFRVGGAERWRGRPPAGGPVENATVYQDIVPDRRIVFAYAMTVDGKRISASLATVELLADGGGTELVFTEQGAFLDGLDGPEGREGGWGGLLDALGRALDRKAA